MLPGREVHLIEHRRLATIAAPLPELHQYRIAACARLELNALQMGHVAVVVGVDGLLAPVELVTLLLTKNGQAARLDRPVT